MGVFSSSLLSASKGKCAIKAQAQILLIGQMASCRKVFIGAPILLILEALAPRKAVGDRPEESLYHSSLWNKYGNGRKSLMRSLRIATSSHSFCGDFMELLEGDNAGSKH